MYMWRAVDSEGEVLEILVQPQREKAAALRLLRKLFRRQGFVPTECLRRLIRSDRRCDVLGRVRSGVVCFVGLHWDQSFGCAAAGAEE